MNADWPAAARDRKLPILDGCALSLKIGSQVVKPLRGRLIRRLFEAVVEIIRRYALIVERRSNRQVAGVQPVQRHLISDDVDTTAVRVGRILFHLDRVSLFKKAGMYGVLSGRCWSSRRAAADCPLVDNRVG